RSPRGNGSAVARGDRQRHPLPALSLLPVGQAQRTDPGLGVGAVGAVRRHVRRRRPMTDTIRTTTLDWRDINVGDEVTPLEIPVTATVIVAGAIASRDFMPVHHDPEFAKK